MKMLSKISTLTLHGRVDVRQFSDENPTQDIATVYGRAADVKTGETDKGEWLAVLGEFRAITPEGDTYFSHKFFPPSKAFAEAMAAALKLSEGRPVDFAVRIRAKYDPSAITQYVYEIESLIDARPSDALAAIEAKIGIAPPPNRPALAAVDAGAKAPSKPAKRAAKG